MPYVNAHAARVDNENIVRQVIIIPFMDDDDDKVTEYCNSIGLQGRWLDTSYLGARRRRYAAIGMKYDSELNCFVEPQPFPSWTLDEVGDWQPPTPMPTDGEDYVWNENRQEWEVVLTV